MQRAEPIEAGTLTLYQPEQWQDETPEQLRRLKLANWITDPRHPLPARVLVNRIWQQQFGAGIVSTPSDFGRNGAPPSHTDLLDWLAKDFIEHGWSIKSLQRLILTSATWQQASTPKAAALEARGRQSRQPDQGGGEAVGVDFVGVRGRSRRDAGARRG